MRVICIGFCVVSIACWAIGLFIGEAALLVAAIVSGFLGVSMISFLRASH